MDAMDNAPAPAPDHRRRMTTLLGLLASEEAQETLAQRLGRPRLAYELACAWFDDVYVPSERYMDGLKGDLSSDAAETFRDAFDPVEAAAMERFHRFFELRIDMLPDPSLASRRIPIDDRWRSLMKDAGYLLEDLGGGPEDFRRRIAESGGLDDVIRTATGSPDTGPSPPAPR